MKKGSLPLHCCRCIAIFLSLQDFTILVNAVLNPALHSVTLLILVLLTILNLTVKLQISLPLGPPPLQ